MTPEDDKKVAAANADGTPATKGPNVSRRLFLGGGAAIAVSGAAPAAVAAAAAAEGTQALTIAQKAIQLGRVLPIRREMVGGMQRWLSSDVSPEDYIKDLLRRAQYPLLGGNGYLGYLMRARDRKDFASSSDKDLFAPGNDLNEDGILSSQRLRAIQDVFDQFSKFDEHSTPADLCDPEVIRQAYAGLNLPEEQMQVLITQVGDLYRPLADLAGADKTFGQLQNMLRDRVIGIMQQAIHNVGVLGDNVHDRAWRAKDISDIAQRVLGQEAMPAPWKALEKSLMDTQRETVRLERLAEQQRWEEANKQEQARIDARQKDQERQREQWQRERAEQEKEYARKRQEEHEKKVADDTTHLRDNGLRYAITPNTQPIFDDPKKGEYWLSEWTKDQQLLGADGMPLTRMHVERLRQKLYAGEDGKTDVREMAKHPPAAIKIVDKRDGRESSLLLTTTDPKLKAHLDGICKNAEKDRRTVTFPALQRDRDAVERCR